MKRDDIRMAALKGRVLLRLDLVLVLVLGIFKKKDILKLCGIFAKEGGTEGLEKLKESTRYVGGVTHDYFKEGDGVLESASESATELAKILGRLKQ